MARHETILKRVPQEELDMFGHSDMSDRTVAAYRSRWERQIKCHYCDEMIDATGLDQLFAEWGPDMVISVSHSRSIEPGDPREPRAIPPELAKDIFLRKDGRNGASPSPNET